jgi:hypothetical protein
MTIYAPVNADDFGLSLGIKRRMIEAYSQVGELPHVGLWWLARSTSLSVERTRLPRQVFPIGGA